MAVWQTLVQGAQAFTLVKEGGEIFVTGSINFNRSVTQEAITAVKSAFK